MSVVGDDASPEGGVAGAEGVSGIWPEGDDADPVEGDDADPVEGGVVFPVDGGKTVPGVKGLDGTYAGVEGLVVSAGLGAAALD